MALDPPTSVTYWMADTSATNQTTPYPSHIYSLQPPFICPHFIVVGNGSVLPITLVGNLVLLRPFYLNDILIALDLALQFLLHGV
jgi:hypothetical protein